MSKFSTDISLSFIPENCRHLKNREEKSVRHVGSKISGSQQTVVSQIYGRRDEKLTKFVVLNKPWFGKYMAEEKKKIDKISGSQQTMVSQIYGRRGEKIVIYDFPVHD